MRPASAPPSNVASARQAFDAAHAAIALRAAVSALARRLRGGATTDGPGAAKLGVLGQLYRTGPLTPTRLAQHERVRLQTLTRLLAELEAERLVRRRSDPADARQTLLTLTAAGRRVLLCDVARREGSLAAAIDARLSARERARLMSACALIDRLTEALADDPAASAAADAAHREPAPDAPTTRDPVRPRRNR